MAKGYGMVNVAVTDNARDDDSSSGPILQLDSITKSFGGLQVLRGIDLKVQRGQIFGLIGPNGCGKSTLFDIITGYQRAETGTVKFQGRMVNGTAPHILARSGLIRTFQLTRVFPNLTVAENLLVFTKMGDHDGEKRAIELLDFVHLLALAEREASTLSYGQLKLLELAQVLMHDPSMLLLDEPLAGINPGLIEEIMEHLQVLRGRGMTILLVEHNLPVVSRLCDRVAVMSAGTVLIEDHPDVVVGDARVKEVFLGE